MGAFGGYERGWDQVSARLDWAAAGIKATDRAAENIVAVVGDNLAYTVDLERMTRHAGDDPTPRTLRCTQAYRRENGEWKVILRHADELPDKDEQQRSPTAAHAVTLLMLADE
jgi:ketosteroid isomerase-like protein